MVHRVDLCTKLIVESWHLIAIAGGSRESNLIHLKISSQGSNTENRNEVELI